MTPCTVMLQHVYRTCLERITPGGVLHAKFVHVVMRVEPRAGFHYSDSCVGKLVQSPSSIRRSNADI